MDDLLVSIIVPVYNVEKYLCKCLDSIIIQTYQNIEIVLVDDGSNDSSGIICDEYAFKDSRIKVVHKDNEGVALARITGFEYSSGLYITFVDGDDYISINYIEKLVVPVNKYHVDLVCCRHFLQFGDKIITPQYTVNGLFEKSQINAFISSDYLYDDKLGHSGIPIFLVTKLIKRDYVETGLLAGKGFWWGEDQLASFHIIMNVNTMFILNESLYYYIRHDGQATSIYNSSLWSNQLRAYLQYKTIDKNNLLNNQLIKHVWKYSFLVNFYKKMPLEIHSYTAFKREMLRIEKMDGWRDFFRGIKTGLGRRDKILYWLTKLRLYNVIYYVFLKRVYEPIK